MEKKKCPRCGEIKILARFNRNASNADGLQGYCRDCQHAYHHTCYKRNMADPEYIRLTNEKDRQRYWNKRKYTFKHAEKAKAYQAGYRKSARGALTKDRYHIKSKFGLSLDDVRDMLDAQKGCCKLCDFDFGSSKPSGRGKHRTYTIDHDHKTGRIRGLLCHQCNINIGYYEKNVVGKEEAFKHYLGATGYPGGDLNDY